MKKLLVIICLLLSFVSTQSQIISTIAGIGVPDFTGDGGPASVARVNYPCNMVLDSFGNMYFVDQLNARIRKIDTAGIITTVAGTSIHTSLGDGGLASAASFSSLDWLSKDKFDNLYIADNMNVRKISSTGIINTVAGNGTSGDTGNGGPATNASFGLVNSLTIDQIGNIYISYNHKVRKVDTTGIITAFAGSNISGFSGDGGPATSSLFFGASCPRNDTANNAYIIDGGNYRIRMVNSAGIIYTIAGNGINAFTGDGGLATNASLSHAISDVVFDKAGNMYIADSRNYRVRKVSITGVITTVAGNGISIYAGDGGPAMAASFVTPTSISFNSKGDMYVSDRLDNRIRRITMPQITIASTHNPRLCAGTRDTFTATVTNDAIAPIYQWQLNGAAVGSNSPMYITDTLHNGDIVLCNLRYVFGDTVTKASNAINIVVDSFPPTAGTLAGADSLCKGDSILLTTTVAGGTWSSTSTNAGVAAGLVHGLHVGTATIKYIVTNGCGSDTVAHLVKIRDCAAGVNAIAPQPTLQLSPNPGHGSFTLTLGSPATEEAHIIITNLMGRPVHQVTTTTNQATPIVLNVPPGIYLLTAITPCGLWSSKVVVE